MVAPSFAGWTTVFDSKFPNATSLNATPGSTPLTGDGATTGTDNAQDLYGNVWNSSAGALLCHGVASQRYFDHQLLLPLTAANYNTIASIKFRGDNMSDPTAGSTWMCLGARVRPPSQLGVKSRVGQSPVNFHPRETAP